MVALACGSHDNLRRPAGIGMTLVGKPASLFDPATATLKPFDNIQIFRLGLTLGYIAIRPFGQGLFDVSA